MSARNPPDPVVEIAASRPGPQVGAFFDLDGTLVAGFTATAHASDRIRRRQARIGEVLGVVEASMRYRFGRMQFERLIIRAAGYLRGESITDLDELGERVQADVGHAVQTRVEEALIDWEPRIDVEEVRVTIDPAERNKLLITISYRVRASNARMRRTGAGTAASLTLLVSIQR